MHTNRLTSTLSFGQPPRSGRQAGADHGGQQLRRDTDRDRQGEQHRVDHRPTQQQIGDEDEHRQRDRHPQQQIGESAQADLEVGFGLAFAQTGGDAAELGVRPVAYTNPGPVAGADDGAHERQIGRIGQRGIRRSPVAVDFSDADRFAGQDALVAFQAVDVDQPHVRGYHFAQRQPDHVTGHQIGDVDLARTARRDAPQRCGEPWNAVQRRHVRRGTR